MTPKKQTQQPPEWEEFLKDVTVERDSHEMTTDPQILADLFEHTFENPIGNIRDVFHDEALAEQIAELRAVVKRKFKGIKRDCFLLLLMTDADQTSIARRLKVSEATVKRHLEDGAAKLRDYFQNNPFRKFPNGRGKRHVAQAALFPLDTDEEKESFVQFINDHVTTHISYSASPPFREAMVVYLEGKITKKYKPSANPAHANAVNRQ